MDNTNFAFDLLKRFKPKKVNDLSLINASLRPSGESYRERLIAKEVNHNPSKIIDNLLKDNNGFLVFQEDTIAFLQQICGLSGSEADNIRRAIGRKDKERLDKAMPSILEGYCSKSDKSRKEAEQEAKEFLKIIEDSSNYQFGYNHSTGYSMIGYMCAYFRYHYPLEFVTSYLNNANTEEDLATGSELATGLNITILPPKFRYSKDIYFPDKSTNTIYKGISSIKFLNSNVANELYSLKNNKYSSFTHLLRDVMINTSANFRQIRILTELNYFSEFGKNKKLLGIIDLYEKRLKNKSLKEKTVEVRMTEILEFEKSLEDKSLDIKTQIKSEKVYLGYCTTINTRLPNNVYSIIEINTKGTTTLKLYQLNSGNVFEYKCLKQDQKMNIGFDEFNIIQMTGVKQKQKRRKENDKYIPVEGEYINYITRWKIML